MKKIASILLALGFSLGATAQKFDYNIRLDYLFDNYEFSHSLGQFDKSMTIHAARLTPSLGFILPQRSGSVIHRVMLGVDLYKNAGEQSDDLLKETTFFYSVDAAFTRGRNFSAIAGCFPRTFSEGSYDDVFFSEKTRFLDNNLEGMFFKYRTPSLYAELGLDWMGMIGDASSDPLRRERFQILTSGVWNFAGPLNLGWAGTFYHFANAPALANIVDNNMLHVYASWTPQTGLDALEVTAGALISYQYDRAVEDNIHFPGGFLSTQRLEFHHIGIKNSLFVGDDMFPFFERSFGGVTYGSDLYFGEPCYHTLKDCTSWNDRVKLYYAPHIADFLELRLGCELHLGEPIPELDVKMIRGWRQTFSVRFNLSKLRQAPKAPRRKSFSLRDFLAL